MELRPKRRDKPLLEIAPLVDVVFLLLIFFMLSSSFIRPEHIELNLPVASSSDSSIKPEPIDIAVTEAGEVHLNDELISVSGLSQSLKLLLKRSERPPIILRSDARADVQHVIAVFDQVQQAGGTNVSIQTREHAGAQ